jgi:hypothetical protein
LSPCTISLPLSPLSPLFPPSPQDRSGTGCSADGTFW